MPNESTYKKTRKITTDDPADERVAQLCDAMPWPSLDYDFKTDKILLARILCLASGEAHWV